MASTMELRELCFTTCYCPDSLFCKREREACEVSFIGHVIFGGDNMLIVKIKKGTWRLIIVGM